MTVSRNRPSPELTAQNPPKKCMAARRGRFVSPGRGAVFPFLYMFYCPSSVLHTHQRVNPCQFSWFHWILKDSSKPKWGVPEFTLFYLMVFSISCWVWRAWQKPKEGILQTAGRRCCVKCFIALGLYPPLTGSLCPFYRWWDTSALRVNNPRSLTGL